MQIIEIYKKLPKTNCGKCGESACMAFALKVHTGRRKLTECPYVEAVDDLTGQGETAIVEDAYELAGDRLQAQLQDADFKAAATAIGAQCDADGNVIHLTMLNGQVEVRRAGLFENGVYCRDSWSRLIVYDYVLRKGDAPLTDKWVPFDHFPGTPSHVKSFQKRAEAELARVFQSEPAALRATLSGLGCVDMQGEAKADFACRLDLLPRIPLFLQFWAEDEDLPASCKLFVDSSAIRYLDIEYIARLVAKCVERVVGYAV